MIYLILFLSCVSQLVSYEFGIVTMFRNEAPYLKEWIEYHHAAGCDRFLMYNDRSSDHWEAVLEPYIQQGLVDVKPWPVPEGSSSYVPTQVEAFKDGIKRSQGNTKWVAMVDIDEFIVPMKDSSIPQCLEKHFSAASAIYVNWRNFGTGGISVPKEEPILFHLTAASFPSHSDNSIGKSFVRPECVDIEGVWYPHHFYLLPNAKYVNGDAKPMYFKERDLPTDGRHHDKYIRINHYSLRDETFFQNNRLAKANKGYGDKNLLLEHYTSFSMVKDYAIINFIRTQLPEAYERIWKSSSNSP